MRTTGQPIVEKPNSPDYGFNQLNFLHMMETNDGNEMILVAVGSRTPHLAAGDYQEVKDRIGMRMNRFNFYSIRKDGFCALECCGTSGKIITKSFLLDDDDLTLNIAASTGRARLAVLDYQGNPYPGFSLEDSLLGNCDGVAVTPRWKNNSLKELIEKRIRFCIELNSGALYSICGSIRPFIVCPQKSISDPLQEALDIEDDGQVHPFSVSEKKTDKN